MRVTLFCLVVVLGVYVFAEDCPLGIVQMECTHLTCSSGYELVCVNNVCTCNPSQAVYCTYRENCTSNNNLPTCWFGWHCIDNECLCGGNFPGK